MILVYIAGPYSKPYPPYNVREAMIAADELWSDGFASIVPHLSMYQDIHKPRPYEDWMKLDFALLERCDCVLRLPGESSGADKEVMLAKLDGKPVFHSIKELLDFFKEGAEA